MEETAGLFTGSFFSSNGRDHLVYGSYLPRGTPLGVVQVVHDAAESFSRYGEFARFLCKNGFAVYGHDHLGHGRSAAAERDLGYFGEDGPDVLLQDLYAMSRIIQEQHPRVPLFLLGEGMGALLTRRYISRHSQLVDGAVLLGLPARRGDGVLSLLCAWLGRFKGRRYRSPALEKLAMRGYNKRITNPGSPNAWLSRDADSVRRYDADPLCGFPFTLWGRRDVLALVRSATEKTWPEGIRQDLGLLLLSGDADPVGGWGKAFTQVNEALAEHPLRNVTLRVYPGARHALLQETNRMQVYEEILSWLRGRLPAARGQEEEKEDA